MLVVQGKNITRFEYMVASGFGLQITMCLQTCPSLSYELAKARACRKHETIDVILDKQSDNFKFFVCFLETQLLDITKQKYFNRELRIIEPIRIIRKIKLKDLELFLLREGYYGKIISYMLFIDFNRPSTLDDFPYLKGIEDEKNFGRSNFIKAIFFSNNTLNNEMKEELVSIAGGFLENKDDCDWNADFEIVCDNNYDVDKIDDYIDRFLKAKYGLQAYFKNIHSFKFNSLSQD